MSKSKSLSTKTSAKDATYTGNMKLSVALSPEQGLNSYLQEIRKFPMLEKDEEFRLAKRWVEDGDTAAAEKMVTSHLRLVAKMWWIRAAIQEYVLRSWSLVKMGTTAAQKKLFFNLRRMKGEMKALEEGDLKPEHLKKIATDLGVKETEVTSMNRRMSGGGDSSLNVTIGGEDGSAQWQDWLTDDTDSQETVLGESQEHDARMDLLRDAMSDLNEREQDIITRRRLAEKPMTLEELAKVYSVSRERIRQIEARAFEKLQAAMLAAAQPAGLLEG